MGTKTLNIYDRQHLFWIICFLFFSLGVFVVLTTLGDISHLFRPSYSEYSYSRSSGGFSLNGATITALVSAIIILTYPYIILSTFFAFLAWRCGVEIKQRQRHDEMINVQKMIVKAIRSRGAQE